MQLLLSHCVPLSLFLLFFGFSMSYGLPSKMWFVFFILSYHYTGSVLQRRRAILWTARASALCDHEPSIINLSVRRLGHSGLRPGAEVFCLWVWTSLWAVWRCACVYSRCVCLLHCDPFHLQSPPAEWSYSAAVGGLETHLRCDARSTHQGKQSMLLWNRKRETSDAVLARVWH